MGIPARAGIILGRGPAAEAGLKNTTKQAEDLRLQLRQSEENLVTEKQAVSNLKAEIAKVKREARLAKIGRAHV